MAKRAVRYCFREPKFPRYGFVGMIPILDDDSELFTIYPTSAIFETMTEFLSQVSETTLALERRGITMAQVCPIISLKLSKTLPLRAQYWQKPQIHLSETDRCSLFHRVLLFPNLHSILATPGGTERKRDIINAAIPLTRPTSDLAVEHFMRLTDFPVDSAATLAAIYDIERVLAVNIGSGEFTKVPELLRITSRYN